MQKINLFQECVRQFQLDEASDFFDKQDGILSYMYDGFGKVNHRLVTGSVPEPEAFNDILLGAACYANVFGIPLDTFFTPPAEVFPADMRVYLDHVGYYLGCLAMVSTDKVVRPEARKGLLVKLVGNLDGAYRAMHGRGIFEGMSDLAE